MSLDQHGKLPNRQPPAHCIIPGRYRPHRTRKDSAMSMTVEVRTVETVTGDFLTEAGEPFYRIELDGYVADFDYLEAAQNFASAINDRIVAALASIATPPAQDGGLVERLLKFEGSDSLGNGDFSVCREAAAHIEHLTTRPPTAGTFADGGVSLVSARITLRWIARTCREEIPLEYTEKMRKVLLRNLAEVAEKEATAILALTPTDQQPPRTSK